MKLIILFAILAMSCTRAQPVEPKKVPVRHGPHRPLLPAKRVCEKPIVVAVIDTGFKYSEVTRGAKLCKFGHKNFSVNGEFGIVPNVPTPVPFDNHGHGTNVAGLIQKYAGDAEFCIVVVKYYDPFGNRDNKDNTLLNSIQSIEYATNIGANYINYSGGGPDQSPRERRAVKKFLDRGGRFIAAAGNEKVDLAEKKFYPAMYDKRIVVVGSEEENGDVSWYSDFGKSVTRWEKGTTATAFGITLTGTSQATAIATGKIIKEQKCEK